MYSLSLTGGAAECLQYVTRALSFLHQWPRENSEEIWAETLLTDVFVLRTSRVNLTQVDDEFNPDLENVLSDGNAIISEEEVDGKVGGHRGKEASAKQKATGLRGDKKTEKVWASWAKRCPSRRRKV